MDILKKIGHAAEEVGKVAVDVAAVAARPTPGQLRYEAFVQAHPDAFLGTPPAWCDLDPLAQGMWEDEIAASAWDGWNGNELCVDSSDWFRRGPVVSAPVIVEPHPAMILDNPGPEVTNRQPPAEHPQPPAIHSQPAALAHPAPKEEPHK